MSDVSGLDFYFEGLNQTMQMDVCGQIDAAALSVPIDVSATAVLYMPVESARAIFKFQSDAHDLTDVSNTDVIFHINDGSWNDLSSNEVNAVRAMFDATDSANHIEYGAAVSAKRLVKHDFVRHMAARLFNTPAGVDLFNNETDLLENIEQKWDGCHANIISQLQAANGLTTGDSPNDTSANIGYEMLKHIASVAPDRLVADANSTDTIYDLSGVQSFPLREGDAINFKLTITGPTDNEDILTTVQTPAAIGSRVYLIKIILGSTANTGASITDTE